MRIALFIALLISGANAQSVPFPGPGLAHSSYNGPGNVVAGASVWWGLRCYNAAYTGNLADVYAPGDASHTLLTCSSGGTINETLQSLATTCGTSCTVKTLYDQSGANSCTGGVPCNFANATEANRPVFVRNCIGALPCMTTSATQQLVMSTTFTSVIAQPYSLSAAGSNAGGTGVNLFSDSLGVGEIFSAAATSWSVYCASSPLTVTSLTSAQFYAMNSNCNGASSVVRINATEVTGSLGGGALSNANWYLGKDNVGDPGGTKILEFGVWPSAISGANRAALETNQKTYWGF